MEQYQTISSSPLFQEFLNRKKKNPSYSLRAFAKLLGISPSYLSLVFSGKRTLPPKQTLKIASKLELSPLESLKLAYPQYALNSDIRKEISNSEFKVVADWKYFAILALGKIKNNRAQDTWISKRLGINIYEAREAFSTLVDLKMIEKSGIDFRVTKEDFTTKNDVPSATIRKFHTDVLEKAKLQIEIVPVEKREFQTMIFAGNSKLFKKAKKMIREFQITLEKPALPVFWFPQLCRCYLL